MTRAAYYINVNSHAIRSNRRGRPPKKPIVVRAGKAGKPVGAWGIIVTDADGNPVAAVRYTPDRPLKCGAEVYVECLYRPKVDRQASRPKAGAAKAARPAQSACRRGPASTGKTP